MTWQKFKVKINPKYKPRERKAIAQEVIDFIVKRTQSGKDKNNNAFKPYSKSYTESLDFKIAGKSKDKVNLTLSGDMLASIKLLKDSKGELTIGFDRSDKDNNDKATGHMTGKYGNSSKIKKRVFLGIKEDDKKKILKNYPLKNDEKRLERTEETIRVSEKTVGAE